MCARVLKCLPSLEFDGDNLVSLHAGKAHFQFPAGFLSAEWSFQESRKPAHFCAIGGCHAYGDVLDWRQGVGLVFCVARSVPQVQQAAISTLGEDGDQGRWGVHAGRQTFPGTKTMHPRRDCPDRRGWKLGAGAAKISESSWR